MPSFRRRPLQRGRQLGPDTSMHHYMLMVMMIIIFQLVVQSQDLPDEVDDTESESYDPIAHNPNATLKKILEERIDDPEMRDRFMRVLGGLPMLLKQNSDSNETLRFWHKPKKLGSDCVPSCPHPSIFNLGICLPAPNCPKGCKKVSRKDKKSKKGHCPKPQICPECPVCPICPSRKPCRKPKPCPVCPPIPDPNPTTTESPLPATTSYPTTTESPVTTTTPVTTTEQPQTTVTASTTTEEPDVPIPPPVTTTESPESTTAPVTTTEEPDGPINGPETTTETPTTTTEVPQTTTEAPEIGTTANPSSTSTSTTTSSSPVVVTTTSLPSDEPQPPEPTDNPTPPEPTEEPQPPEPSRDLTTTSPSIEPKVDKPDETSEAHQTMAIELRREVREAVATPKPRVLLDLAKVFDVGFLDWLPNEVPKEMSNDVKIINDFLSQNEHDAETNDEELNLRDVLAKCFGPLPTTRCYGAAKFCPNRPGCKEYGCRCIQR